MKKMLITPILLLAFFISFAQKVDSVKIIYDKDGGQGILLYTDAKVHYNGKYTYKEVNKELSAVLGNSNFAQADDSLSLVVNEINTNIKKEKLK